MQIEIYLYIALSAGAGTGIVEFLIKPFLSHWLERKFHKFTLSFQDKRSMADELLALINVANSSRWLNFQDDIYNKAYDISDRLIAIGEERYSKKLDHYIGAQRYAKTILDKFFTDSKNKALNAEIISSQHEIDALRLELVKSAQRMKK
jgi:hypothetical protein